MGLASFPRGRHGTRGETSAAPGSVYRPCVGGGQGAPGPRPPGSQTCSLTTGRGPMGAVSSRVDTEAEAAAAPFALMTHLITALEKPQSAKSPPSCCPRSPAPQALPSPTWAAPPVPATATVSVRAGGAGPRQAPTFALHAHEQALLVAAVLAAVALALVDEAALAVPAGVQQVLADGPLEEALAALAAVHAVVLACAGQTGRASLGVFASCIQKTPPHPRRPLPRGTGAEATTTQPAAAVATGCCSRHQPRSRAQISLTFISSSNSCL